MSLRKSPSRTPAFMAAQRANAKKSTGPRTRDGKGLAKLNALKNGRHSRVWKRFTDLLVQAPADLDLVRKLTLSRAESRHWRFAKLLEDWPKYQSLWDRKPDTDDLVRSIAGNQRLMKEYGAALARANGTRLPEPKTRRQERS